MNINNTPLYAVPNAFQKVNRNLPCFLTEIDSETVLMHTDNFRPDITLFKDIYAKPWIRDYALAVSKMMLGEARGKFNTIAGPQGGTTLNGGELKQQGIAEMEKLDQEIGNFAEGGTPHSFVIG